MLVTAKVHWVGSGCLWGGGGGCERCRGGDARTRSQVSGSSPPSRRLNLFDRSGNTLQEPTSVSGQLELSVQAATGGGARPSKQSFRQSSHPKALPLSATVGQFVQSE
jgi:hypothetical protein